MRNVVVNKGELLEVLEKNRQIHLKEFNEALIGYRAALNKAFKNALKALKKTTDNDLVKFDRYENFNDLPVPENHTKEYDLAIRMLQSSVEDKIELSKQEFDQYYFDEWTWSASAKLSNSTYSNSRH